MVLIIGLFLLLSATASLKLLIGTILFSLFVVFFCDKKRSTVGMRGVVISDGNSIYSNGTST